MADTAGPGFAAWIEACVSSGSVGGAASGYREVKLASDAFGNFVVQKLLEHGTAEQLEANMARQIADRAGDAGKGVLDLTRSCSRRSRAMRLGGNHGFGPRLLLF